VTSADLQRLVTQRPFVSLRLFVTDGTFHDVRRQELIWVGPGMASLVVPVEGQGEAVKPLMERIICLDLRHILKVEIIAPSRCRDRPRADGSTPNGT